MGFLSLKRNVFFPIQCFEDPVLAFFRASDPNAGTWLRARDPIERMLLVLENEAPSSLLSAADLERLRLLPEPKRRAARRRLALVAAWRGEGRRWFTDAEQAAAYGSMSRRSLFTILSRGERLDLDDLGLRLSGPGIREGAPFRLDAARAEVAAVLSKAPGASLGQLTCVK